MTDFSAVTVGWWLLFVAIVYMAIDIYFTRKREMRTRETWTRELTRIRDLCFTLDSNKTNSDKRLEEASSTLRSLEKVAVAELHETQHEQQRLSERQLQLAQEMVAVTQTAGVVSKEFQEVKKKVEAVSKAKQPKKLHKAHKILLDKFRAAGSMVSTSSDRFIKLREELFATTISREDDTSKISYPTRMGAKVTDEIIEAGDDANTVFVGNHELTPAQAVVVATCLLEWASHGRLIFGDPAIEPDELVVTPSPDVDEEEIEDEKEWEEEVEKENEFDDEDDEDEDEDDSELENTGW